MSIRSTIFAAGARVPGAAACALGLRHDGLRKHRLVRGENAWIVQRKAEIQAAEWEARWRVVEARQRDLAARLAQARHAEEQRALAAERSALARQELDQLAALLKFPLAVYDPVDWELLKERASFGEERPEAEAAEEEPPAAPPREPQATDAAYLPALGLGDLLFRARKAAKLAASRARFAADHARWTELAAGHAEQVRRQFLLAAHRAEAHAFQIAAWEERRREFLARKAAVNAAVDEIRHAYFALAPAAVAEYADLVLSQSQYPDCLPREFDVDYRADPVRGRCLVVDYRLPCPADLPSLEAVEHLPGAAAFAERHLAAQRMDELYDRVACQIALRSLYELFAADTAGAFDSIVFNGKVASASSGDDWTAGPCILSLGVRREEFQRLHLAQVDPEPCLRALGAVAGERLHELVPVPPLVQRNASAPAPPAGS